MIDDNDRSSLTPIDVHLTINRRHLVFGGTIEDVAKVRPGDEVRIAWDGRTRGAVWARVTGVERRRYAWPRGAGAGGMAFLDAFAQSDPKAPETTFVTGRTTFGDTITAAIGWVTDVRAEPNEAIRASWVARYPA